MKDLQPHEKKRFEELAEALDFYGPSGFIREVVDLNNRYFGLMRDIQNGLYSAERDPNESADLVLRDLREYHSVESSDVADRSYFLLAMADLIQAVDGVVRMYQAATRN